MTMRTKTWYTLGAAYALFAASPALAQFHPIQDGWTPRPRVIQVTVDSSGFVPSEIHVKKGENVRLVFTRTVDRTCATAVVVRYLGIIRELPVGEAVAVALKAEESGTIRYTCPKDTIGGTVVVD
jgi:plastocyanin domain-containing protein